MTVRLALAVVALALLASTGCAAFGPDVVTIPPPPKPEPVAERAADDAGEPGDETGIGGEAAPPDETPGDHELPSAPAPEGRPASPDAGPDEAHGAPADEVPAAVPPIAAEPEASPPAADEGEPADDALHPVLLDGTSERLRTRTQRELDDAQKRIDELGERELDEDETSQVERAARFVATAREALAKGDIHRAANLCRKAAVLLADLD